MVLLGASMKKEGLVALLTSQENMKWISINK